VIPAVDDKCRKTNDGVEMLTQEEQSFISGIETRFHDKHIMDKFNFYARIEPHRRLQQAEADLQTIQRQGWVRIGVPPETMQNIYEHEVSMVRLIQSMPTSLATNEKEKAQQMAYYHDITEAIVSDFTPLDPITKDEKARLESIAARIIFESHPKQHEFLQEFEENTSRVALFVNDTDQLEMVSRALYIEERHPHMADALTPFWDYAGKKLSTDDGHALFTSFIKDRFNLQAGTADRSDVYTAIRAHYAAQRLTPKAG
jgi:putative hydrolase of HD superfamily